MKKIIALILAAAMVLCFAACGGKTKPSSNTPAQTAESETTEAPAQTAEPETTEAPAQTGDSAGNAAEGSQVNDDHSGSDVTEAAPDDIEESENNLERVALDTTCLKAVSFDAMVLMGDEYYICYESVDRQSGDVSFEEEERSDVRFLTFEEDGRGCFWIDEKGRPFSYEMDSDYSCALSFDDGGKASVGLYADQGGALPRISEEGHIWLALYFDDEVIWFW